MSVDRAVSSSSDEVHADLELALLLDGLFRRSGLDLRACPGAQLRSVVDALRLEMGGLTITGLLERIVHHDAALQRVKSALTAMLPLNEPWQAIATQWRTTLLPLLRSTPFPTLWLLDCAESVWLPRLIGLLLEENLLPRCTLFVTRSETAQLPAVGAIRSSLINHFGVAAGSGKLIVVDYNIHTDASFGEFDFILCGVQTPQLTAAGQRRLMRLLGASLSSCGVLQIAEPSGNDAVCLAPIFLPLAKQSGLYRHAMLVSRTQSQHRFDHRLA